MLLNLSNHPLRAAKMQSDGLRLLPLLESSDRALASVKRDGSGDLVELLLRLWSTS